VDEVIEGRLKINFDISFHAISCSDANIDAMDLAGEQQNAVDAGLTKYRLTKAGGQVLVEHVEEHDDHDASHAPVPDNYCGPCYGAELRAGQCCNTCDELRSLYAERGWSLTEVTANSEQCQREHRGQSTKSEEGEGCRVVGSMTVNKVAGNFHVAIGETHTRGAGHIHQFNPQKLSSYNVSHTIHRLSFGEDYPGIRNPLDGWTHGGHGQDVGGMMYFIKVIPTVFLGGKAGTISTNQYSVTKQFRDAVGPGMQIVALPGVFFVYDISPFMMTVTQHSPSFLHLVTSLFAIMGGVLTLSKIIETLLVWALLAINKRIRV
ncbi:hypothetical protein EON62_06035, partial [archaeon]